MTYHFPRTKEEENTRVFGSVLVFLSFLFLSFFFWGGVGRGGGET